jgi:flagellar biosynthetic protein FliQ
MAPDIVLDVTRHALQVVLLMLVVLLTPALIVGLLVSMFQAATQINEMTLSFIPKLLVTILVLMIGGPWLLGLLVEYAQQLIESVPYLVG